MIQPDVDGFNRGGFLRQKIRKPVKVAVDPLVKALTRKKIAEDVQEFLGLLDAKTDEQRIHEFLANHSYFFNSILRLSGASPLYSKIRLGSEYEVDFVCFDTGSVGPEWYLIEIEAPNQTLFTKSGSPSSSLTHAIQQVRNWNSWLHDNLPYAQRLLPHIEYPLAYVFMGRRHDITSDLAKLLRRLNHDHRMMLEIHTLDWFVSAAESAQNFLGRKGGNWSLPMKALSHAHLARGLPKNAKDYIERYFKGPMADLYPREFLRDRQHKEAHMEFVQNTKDVIEIAVDEPEEA
jgi:hypothetical protein